MGWARAAGAAVALGAVALLAWAAALTPRPPRPPGRPGPAPGPALRLRWATTHAAATADAQGPI